MSMYVVRVVHLREHGTRLLKVFGLKVFGLKDFGLKVFGLKVFGLKVLLKVILDWPFFRASHA